MKLSDLLNGPKLSAVKTTKRLSEAETSVCPACGSTTGRMVWEDPPELAFRLRRCSCCQLVYTVPRLSHEEMKAYYSSAYYGQKNVRFNWWVEKLIGFLRRRRARKIHRFRGCGKVLDVGCGRGAVLAHLRDWGWETSGIEISEMAASHAREVLGLEVAIGHFDGVSFPVEFFDVVIFWHVLEHLPDVTQALAGAERILKPGGLLVIAVPNISSWQAQLSKYHWFHLDLPRHYSHFSVTWLRKALGIKGFRIKEISHFSFEQNPYGWVQSILNSWGFRKNLLYDLFKAPSARSVTRPFGEFPIQSACCFLLSIFLSMLACLVLVPECIFRKGGTIELYARRCTRSL